MAKYIFFTGGVASGLGKGIVAASLGRLLKARGHSVALLKLDPYFNMDSGFISPYQHGEIFVTNDGAETDLVVGHYERILGGDMLGKNAVTSGRIYSAVMEKERAGAYTETVQIVPHITDEIKNRVLLLDDGKTDFIITEIGGTVGDIECTPFLEAIRQIQSDVGRRNVAYVHITLVPFIEMSGEQKTKPTQRSVKELQDIGVQPDAIVCRSDYPIDKESKKKLSQFCNVSTDAIITSLTGDEIYDMPLKLEAEGLASVVLKKLNLQNNVPDLETWISFAQKAAASKAGSDKIRIGIIGKYTDKHSAYVSLSEALFYSACAMGKTVEAVWIPSEELTAENVRKRLKNLNGIVVPAGFGPRGFEGKITACEYARVNNLPALMIGMGAQAAFCGFLRNACGINDASSEEFGQARDSAAIRRIQESGAAVFKLGAYKSVLVPGSKLSSIYTGPAEIVERHRHKFEFSPVYRELAEKNGLMVSAVSADTNIAEAFELKNHKFYIGLIYRPEFKARPDAPHPVFDAFINACKP